MRNLILLILFMPCLAMAQTVSMSDQKWQAFKDQKDSLQRVTDSLSKANVSLSRIIAEKDSLISQQGKTIQEQAKQQSQSGTTLDDVQAKLKKAQEENDTLKNYIEYADSCVIRYANAQLYIKYEPKRVTKALDALNHILNKDMANKGKLEALLKGYKNYYEEIKSIITESQNNKDRKNPFSTGFPTSVKSQIENTAYYRAYYNKGGISIPYLNNILKEILNVVNSARPNERKFCDFSSILKEMQ